MAVAFDASSETTFTTTSPATFTHTPSGTPRGIILAIAHGTVSTDLITGAVTYGGVAMERVGNVADTSGEPGRFYLYFLGENIPTGAQTVSITHTGSADVKWTSCASVTASADTEAGTGGWDNANGTNPSWGLTRNVSGMCFGGIYWGGALASITPQAGMTAIQDHDFGAFIARFDRETTASASNFTFGYTAASDDTALAVISVIEKVSGVRSIGSAIDQTLANTTVVQTGLSGQIAGKNMYVHCISRDHTSGTALATCVDNSGVGSWTLVSNDTDRKAYVWWKLGTAEMVGSAITVSGLVGSSAGGVVIVAGGDTSGDPTRDLTVETNASGDETHAAFTPTAADSLVMFSIMDYGNDSNPATSVTCTDPGSLEPEFFDTLSTGGSDCRILVTGRRQTGGPTTTGNFTWSQTDSTTKSVAYTVIPAIAAVTGTGAATLDGATSAGTGIESMLATGASTLDGVTSAGSGSVVNPISGTGASTLAGVTSAGVGVEGFPATGSSTLDGVTSAGAGVVANPVTGTGASTLAGVTSSGTGTAGFPGTGSSTLDGVTSQGSGVVANPVTGTGASVLDGVTSQGTGEVSVPGHIENVVCDLLGPVGDCEDIGPSGDCDSVGPLCVGSITT